MCTYVHMHLHTHEYVHTHSMVKRREGNIRNTEQEEQVEKLYNPVVLWYTQIVHVCGGQRCCGAYILHMCVGARGGVVHMHVGARGVVYMHLHMYVGTRG